MRLSLVLFIFANCKKNPTDCCNNIFLKSPLAQKPPEYAGVLLKDERKMAIVETKLILHPSPVEDANVAIQFNNQEVNSTVVCLGSKLINVIRV